MKKLAICKSRNGELGNGMKEMLGIRLGMWGIRVGMRVYKYLVFYKDLAR